MRLVIATDATVVWSADNWASINKIEANPISALNVLLADLPTAKCPDGSVIEFSFFWKNDQRWEGRNYSVAVSEAKMGNK